MPPLLSHIRTPEDCLSAAMVMARQLGGTDTVYHQRVYRIPYEDQLISAASAVLSMTDPDGYRAHDPYQDRGVLDKINGLFEQLLEQPEMLERYGSPDTQAELSNLAHYCVLILENLPTEHNMLLVHLKVVAPDTMLALYGEYNA